MSAISFHSVVHTPLAPAFVGIDVSKARLDVSDSPETKPFSVDNTPRGRAVLLRRLRRTPVDRVVVESSGGYERDLLLDLMVGGLNVAHVNPRVVRDFAKSYNLLAKTDAIDARLLADYGRTMQPAPTPKPDAQMILLDDLVTRGGY